MVRLPARWRVARDGAGRLYYYHAHTRQTQWEPPDSPDHQEEVDQFSGGAEQHSVEAAEEEEDGGEDGEDTDTEDDSDEEGEENGVDGEGREGREEEPAVG